MSTQFPIYNSLSLKHQLFVDAMIENQMNQTKSYLKVYNCAYDTARSKGSELGAKDIIIKAIKEKTAIREAKIDISLDAQLSRLFALLEDAGNIENDKHRAQLQLDILKEINKMGGLSFKPDKTPSKGSISISVDVLKELGKGKVHELPEDDNAQDVEFEELPDDQDDE